MSGSKLLRLCSLFLCLLLCLANFSVVANAAEDFSEVSDLSKWQVASDSDYNVSVDYKYNSTYGYFYRYSITNGFNVGDYATLYSVPELTVGSTYKFNFTMIHPGAGLKFFDYGTLVVGFANLNSDGSLTAYEGSYIEISDPSTQLPDSFTDFEINFTYNGVGSPYLVIWTCTHTAYDSNTDLPLYFSDISLTKLASETDKKLDGILGWLQGIFDSISSLPETISTKFSTFFTNLENDITSLGDSIGGFFSDLKNKLSSEFSNLFASIAERWDVLDNFLLEIRNFFHDLYWDLVGGTCKYGDYHSSLFERLGDRISGFFDDLKLKIDLKVEEIKTSIHDFFVPPEGFFEEWKVKFDLMLSENLGFIYEVPDIIISFVTTSKNILSTDEEVSIVFPEIKLDLPGTDLGKVVLIEETEVDLTFLDGSDVFSFLYYSAYPTILHIIFLCALIGYGKFTLERTLSN